VAQEKDLLRTSIIKALLAPFALAGFVGIGWFIYKRIDLLKINRKRSLPSRRSSCSCPRVWGQAARGPHCNVRQNNRTFFLMFTSETAFALDKKYKGQDKNNCW